MGEKQLFESPITAEIYIELHREEKAAISKNLDEEIKVRRKREFILIIICLLAVLYTYPVKELKKNPTIDITAISLKIPLKDAITVFPTIIAAIYLVFLSSAIKQAFLMISLDNLYINFEVFKKSGKIPKVGSHDPIGGYPTIYLLRYILLPTALHQRGSLGAVPEFAIISRSLVDVFVGFVFSALPFGTSIFVLIKSWPLLNSKVIFAWNVVCLIVMVLAFLSSGFQIRGGKYWPA